MTIFIIIGIVLLFIVGAALYMTGRVEEAELELAKPRLTELPEKVQPIREMVQTCMDRLGMDGLRRVGDSGGYIDWERLKANYFSTTEGEAVQLAPDGKLNVAYWWFMKSKNRCMQDCEFASKRPPLTKSEGANSIEAQLEDYVQKNLLDCLGTLTEFQGCDVRAQEQPKVTVTVGEGDVIFFAKYPLQVLCEDQSFTVDEYAVDAGINLKEMYDLATNITNVELQDGILEQATNIIIGTFSGLDSRQLPPYRGLEFGPPGPGKFWIKYDVSLKLRGLLAAYIPMIQVFGTRNYEYIRAPDDARDPELFENLYNRQFLIPLNDTFPGLETRFAYLDWWEPYFDLNCNGQLCSADSFSSMRMLPMSMNRYEFAYDVSYPVMFEIRDPFAFGGDGYTFRIMLEQNMRNSARFKSDSQLLPPAALESAPSIFCNPDQRTSGDVVLSVLNADKKRPLDGVAISYLCGDNVCNVGQTMNGTFVSKFPRCIGGRLQVSKPGFDTLYRNLDTFDEDVQNLQIIMDPVRTVNASVKNYLIVKEGKLGVWKFEEATGLVRPRGPQQTIVMMTQVGGERDEPFFAVADIKGAQQAELRIVPGKYKVQITSLLREKIKIPPYERCFTIKKVFSSKEKCQMIPEKPVVFNETSPFPYGLQEFEFTLTREMLEGARLIEFRQFVMAIDKLEEKERTVEDMGALELPQTYVESNPVLVWPVVVK